MNLLQNLQDQVDFTVACPQDSFLSQRADQMGLPTVEININYPSFETSDLVQSAYDLQQRCTDDDFDLIYTHHLPAAMIGQILSSLWHIPLLLTVDSRYLRPAYEDFMRLFPCYVMSASQSGYDYILEHDLCSEERLFVAQPGINLDEFHTQQSKTKTQAFRRFELKKQLVIGVVARLVPDKGVDRAIEATHLMKQNNTLNARLLIAGDGVERQALEALVAELGMTDDVQFMGQLQPEEMPDFYQMMDVYVLATQREGCPISVLEAMSSGVPVVATSVGDIPYLVQSGKNGYTIEEPDPSQIAELLAKILEDETFTRKTRAHNAPIVPLFDYTIQAQKVHHIFSSILEHDGD